jgi:SAM-dependent methyltransferase
VKPSADIQALLASYPRQRAPLTPAHAAVFEAEYRRNRSGQGGLLSITARLEAWMHRGVAGGAPGGRLLELGAGTLNHVPYERNVAVYDAVEPWQSLWQDSPNLTAVNHLYNDLAEIEESNRYDRIVSVAVLEHLTDLPAITASCGLLLTPAGRFLAGIPSEGGILWGLAWRLTTGMAYRLRHGINYGAVMRHEHVNDASEIRAIVGYFFHDVTERRFPLPFFHLSFYTLLEASRPNVARCAAWLA